MTPMTPFCFRRYAPKTLVWVVAALVTAVACMQARAQTPIPPGKWSFVFSDKKGHPERPMRVYTYRPAKCDAKCPLVITVHGVSRNASGYRDYWELAADRYNLVIVAPEFSREHWAGFNEGVRPNEPREKWAVSVIEHLFDEVGDGRKDYIVFGHSAGAQLVHRLALFRPDNRSSVMIAANAGWYAMPEWRKDKKVAPFPYSLVDSPAGEKELREALQRRMILMLGEKDSDPNAKSLNQAPGALAQGAGRVERGENFYKAATAAAGELGVKLGWQLHEVPDTAHQGSAMARFAADTLFGKK